MLHAELRRWPLCPPLTPRLPASGHARASCPPKFQAHHATPIPCRAAGPLHAGKHVSVAALTAGLCAQLGVARFEDLGCGKPKDVATLRVSGSPGGKLARGGGRQRRAHLGETVVKDVTG